MRAWICRVIGLVLLLSVWGWAGTSRAAADLEPFQIAVLVAADQWLPASVRQALPLDEAGARAALAEGRKLLAQAPKDPDAHYLKVRQLWQGGAIDGKNLAAELAAVSLRYLDVSSPDALRRHLGGVPAAPRFDGYHHVKRFGPWLESLDDHTMPVLMRLEDAKPETAAAKADLAALFGLYVNATVDLWTSLAKDAGKEPGAGQPPAAAAEVDPLTRDWVNQARQAGVLEDLATGGGDEMVFDEGLNISGDEAKQTASQLKNSNVQVDSGGVDRMKNLDPETLAALDRLGIDVKSARPPYKGTRGGVKPGETVKVGDLDFKIDGLSSVEIGSRDQKAVYMQVPDAALGAEGSSGRLDQKVVATVIGANIGAFKTCFERRLREIPDLSGRVFVQFTIKTDGSVADVKVLQNTSDDQQFADCIMRQVQRLRFPPPKGGEVVFVFPFIFEQAYSF